jgi:predicted NUDIX family phosphoesterase
MKKKKAKENVIVVPREKLFEDHYFEGFLSKDLSAFEKLLDAMDLHWISKPRAEVEEDPGCKQIIPYCVLTYLGKIFVVKRFNTQGEQRLHNKHSIGIGGHMRPSANGGDRMEVILDNLERELSEELEGVELNEGTVVMGMINDDSDPVGRVHFGLVFNLRVKDPGAVRVRETDQMEGGFCRLSDAFELPDYENWSRILLNSAFSRHV